MRSTERGRWFGDGGSRVVSNSTAVYPPIHTPAPGARLSVQSHDIAWAGRSKEEVCTHVAAHAVVHVVGIEGAQQIQLLPSKKFEHRSAQARARTRTHAQTGSARRHTHTQQRARRQPRSAQSAACAAAQRRRPGNTHRTLACIVTLPSPSPLPGVRRRNSLWDVRNSFCGRLAGAEDHADFVANLFHKRNNRHTAGGRQAPHGCGRRGPSVSERGSHGRRSAAGQVCAMGGTCVRWLRRGSARVLRAHRIARGARCEVSR